MQRLCVCFCLLRRIGPFIATLTRAKMQTHHQEPKKFGGGPCSAPTQAVTPPCTSGIQRPLRRLGGIRSFLGSCTLAFLRGEHQALMRIHRYLCFYHELY